MPPLTLMIKPVSSMCNMRCKYCFYADVTQHRQTVSYGVMSDETLEKLVRRAFAYAEGSVTFAFQGGEPTLAGAKFFEKLLELERKYNSRRIQVQNSIQTNAFDLSDELIDVLRRGHFLVGISLDGPAEIHDRMRIDARGAGTYATVTRNIERLKAAGIEYNILCVVNGYIARAPREVWQALAPHTYLQFIPCLDGFDGVREDYSLSADDYLYFLKETFDLYYQAFKRRQYVSVRTFDNYVGILLGQLPENCAMQGRCGIYYLIEGDGGVYPCDFYVLDRWRMGDINRASFHTLAKSEVAAEFRSQSHYTSPECRECKWAKLCRGGCKRDREPFVEVKDADGSTSLRPGLNRFCGAFKEFFEYSYSRMEEMAREIAAERPK
ncbi:MAG: anaerobic sulfatase maturase [Candidatus Fimadaptatus sp.]|jgi:uncharacterized protein